MVETVRDLLPFKQFVIDNPFMGFDTETTGGFNWWDAPDKYGCRLAQFGNHDTAWVIPVELGSSYVKAMKWALATAERLAAHNRGFDLHVIEECFGVDPYPLVQKMWDTKILAHLVDSRGRDSGGPGLKLEELVPHYIDADMGARVKKSMNEIAQDLNSQKELVGYKARDSSGQTLEFRFADDPEVSKESLKARGLKYIREFNEGIYGKVSKDTVWSKVPLNHEGYNLYAGMDPIWAFRLTKILFPKISKRSIKKGLIGWEHRINWVTYQLERAGYLVDDVYAWDRIQELKSEESKWRSVAVKWGVELIGSADQIVTALERIGHKFTKDSKRTKPSKEHPKGQLSVDDSVLQGIDHPLTEAIIKAKSAQKKRKTWFEAAYNNRDRNGRVHVNINPLQARTARMSVTGAIAAQTLPSGTGYVRHCFLAEPGHVTACIDFANQELRVAAALSGDKRMLAAFANGEDLHQLTADAAGVSRKIGKMCNFLIAYGGGAKALSEQADIPLAQAKKVVEGFNRLYPGVAAYARKRADEARRNGGIYTITGRWLIVDPGHEYAAINFAIQSAARDITVSTVLDLHEAGFTPYIRLIVHDEVVFSFPKERAAELTAQAEKIMEFNKQGIYVPAEGEIGEQSWGSVLDAANSKH
ncbi:DNA polymerase [Streptomyces sp. NBC_01500]|uniref:DNA polymerase n=1 Tax=Streptomyces sp. NBC_01500 TaxID=2903886 RepID=UPI002252F4C8|nr:DNA polymerase [Streptomyces sp. NBC_01500]MCX4554105.1 DNA polymerase [Streptomyces sp. NBC_01500]